uniref:Topoisomerase 6 subunit A/Spo11 TOPRIM domain-containing protein n=1 Tax=Hyaloperonospora arabidopsidis (strain Emoy2) TaxID=559515 RepID=M4C224_HYAAE
MYDHETKQQFHGNETRLIKLVQLSAVMNRQGGRRYTGIWLILQTVHALLTEHKTATQESLAYNSFLRREIINGGTLAAEKRFPLLKSCCSSSLARCTQCNVRESIEQSFRHPGSRSLRLQSVWPLNHDVKWVGLRPSQAAGLGLPLSSLKALTRKDTAVAESLLRASFVQATEAYKEEVQMWLGDTLPWKIELEALYIFGFTFLTSFLRDCIQNSNFL